MIYFDHNATTPVDERVVEAMLPYLNIFYGNPSSLYRAGRVVRSAINTAREQVAALIDAQAEQVVFTSGGTEANNLAIHSISKNSRVIISSIEHPSIFEPANNKKALSLFQLAVNQHGQILPESVEALFRTPASIDFVSVMLANNENGAIQNITELIDQHKDKQFVMHTDAIQAVGKIPVSFRQLGVDMMSMSSHKIYGPKGSGALVVNKTVAVTPLIIGGGQENGWRSGTENVAGIVGFGKAADLARLELDQRAEQCLTLRRMLEQVLRTIPGLVIFAEQAQRLPNTVQFGIKGQDGEMLLMQLDQKNIAVSSGSACSSGGGKASSVLTAMGVGNKLAKSAIRISLGKSNKEQDIIEFAQALKSILNL